ncbi:MAG TPA: hypothetical protein VGW38_29645 [Chloroflexota bacterium]|nr:hypothetical protein [Chloroflexota bacterium]
MDELIDLSESVITAATCVGGNLYLVDVAPAVGNAPLAIGSSTEICRRIRRELEQMLATLSLPVSETKPRLIIHHQIEVLPSWRRELCLRLILGCQERLLFFRIAGVIQVEPPTPLHAVPARALCQAVAQQITNDERFSPSRHSPLATLLPCTPISARRR